MRIENYIALAAQVIPLQARDEAARGIDPSNTMAVAARLRELVALFEDPEPAPSFDGIEEIDLTATSNGIRRRLMDDQNIELAKLYELGQALNTVVVSLQSKARELAAKAETLKKN